ncbi:MAG: hypothetical protein RLZZ174_1427, partial [Pseudomonadota bacterium]
RSTGGGDVRLTANGLSVAKDALVSTVGDGVVTLDGTFSDLRIEGQVLAEQGDVRLLAANQVTLVNESAPVDMREMIQTRGTVEVRAANGLALSDGTAVRDGIIGAAFAGGRIAVTGALTLTPETTLAFKVDQPSDSPLLTVSGAVTADGTVAVDWVNDYTPQLDQDYALLSAGALSGTFAGSAGLFGYDDGKTFAKVDVDNPDNPTAFGVTVVPRPAASTLDIVAHAAADAAKLGTFFNAAYFDVSSALSVGMTVSTQDFATLDGEFQLAAETGVVTNLVFEDGGTGTARVTRYVIGGTDLDAFLGLNGPYRVDSDRDGDLEDEVVNPNAAGFEVTGITGALAVFLDENLNRTWVQAQTLDGSPELQGLGDALQISAENLRLELNVGSDRTVVDLGAGLTVATDGQGSTQILDVAADAGQLVRVAADFDIAIDGFVQLQGSAAMEKSTQKVTLADGQTVTVDSLTLGATGLNAFAGVGGPYFLSDGTTSQSAAGVAMSNTEVALAFMAAKPGQPLTGTKWLAADAATDSVGLVGLPDAMVLQANNLALSANLVLSTPQDQDPDSLVLDLAEALAIDVATGPETVRTLDFDGARGQLLRASGEFELQLADFVRASGSLAIERSVQTLYVAEDSDGAATEIQAETLQFGGQDLEGFVGIGGAGTDVDGSGVIEADEYAPGSVGLGVDGVDFAFALATAKDSADHSYGGQRWLVGEAAIAQVLTPVGIGGGALLDVRDLGLELNLGLDNDKALDLSVTTDASGTVTDRSLSVGVGTGVYQTLDLSAERGETVRAFGSAELNLGNALILGGTVGLERSSPSLRVTGELADRPIDGLALSMTNVYGFLGASGPYHVDSNGDGFIDLNDTPNAEAKGLALTGGNLGIFVASDENSDSEWLAIKAGIDAAEVVGVDGFEAYAKDLSLEVNRAVGDDAKVLDFATTPLVLTTGEGQSLTFDMDGADGELTRAQGRFGLNIQDFIQVHGELALELADRTLTLANGETVEASGLTLGGANLSAFAGVGGPYFVDSNNDGLINGDDTRNENATGVVLDNANVALALLEGKSDQGALARTSWLALEAGSDTVGFQGTTGFEATLNNTQFVVNQVFGAPALDPQGDYVIDAAAMASANTPFTVLTGPTTDYDMTADGGLGELLRVATDIKLSVGDFLAAQGSVALEKSTQDLTLSNGATLSHDVLTIGGANLSAFAGMNGGLNTDGTPVDGASGFALTDLDLALVVATQSTPVMDSVAAVVGNNAAARWQWVDLTAAGGTLYALARQDQTPENLTDASWGPVTALRSVDNGASWETWGNFDGLNEDLIRLSVSLDGQTTSALGRDGKLWRSLDGGETFAAEANALGSDAPATVASLTDIVSLDGGFSLVGKAQAPVSEALLSLGGVPFLSLSENAEYRLVLEGLTADPITIELDNKRSFGVALTQAIETAVDRVNSDPDALADVSWRSNSSSVATSFGAFSFLLPGVEFYLDVQARDAAEPLGRLGLELVASQPAAMPPVVGINTTVFDATLPQFLRIQGGFQEGDQLTIEGLGEAPLTVNVPAEWEGLRGEELENAFIGVLSSKVEEIRSVLPGVLSLRASGESAGSIVVSHVAANGTPKAGLSVIPSQDAVGSALLLADGEGALQAPSLRFATMEDIAEAFGGDGALSFAPVAKDADGKARFLVVSGGDAASKAQGNIGLVTQFANAGTDSAAPTPSFKGYVLEDLTRNASITQPWAAIAASTTLNTVAVVSPLGQLLVADLTQDDWQWREAYRGVGRTWSDVAVSADGQAIAVVGGSPTRPVSLSLDGGLTWTDYGLDGGSAAGIAAVELVSDGEGSWKPLVLTAAGELLQLTSVARGQRVALEASTQSVGLVGIEGLTASASDLSLKVNLADDAGVVLDFSGGDFSVTTGPNDRYTMTLDGALGQQLTAAGAFELGVGGYLYASGELAFSLRDATVDLSDGSQADVRGFAIAGTELSAFAGVNGPYRDGVGAVNPDAVGVVIDQVDFAGGVFFAEDADTQWLSLTASANTMGLVGLPLEIGASNVDVVYNQVLSGDTISTDLPVLDLAANPLAIGQVGGTVLELAVDGSQGAMARVEADAVLALAGVIRLEGRIGFEQSQRKVTLTDETSGEVDILAVSLSNGSALISAGASEDALRLEVDALNSAIVLATTAQGSSLEGGSWMSLMGDAERIALLGGERFDASLTGETLGLRINTRLDGSGPVIDWTQSDPMDVGIYTLAMAGEVLDVAGTMTVAVGDALTASGSVRVVRDSREILVDGELIEAAGLLIGATDVTAVLDGVGVSGGSLALAFMQAEAPSKGDERAWITARAQVDNVLL